MKNNYSNYFFPFQGLINEVKKSKSFFSSTNLVHSIKFNLCLKNRKSLFFCLMQRSASLHFLYFRMIFLYSKNFCFTSSRIFLYRVRPYWHFFFFSSSQTFLYRSREYIHFLLFTSSERFWYLSPAFFEDFLCFSDNILLTFLYIEKTATNKTRFHQFFICLKN